MKNYSLPTILGLFIVGVWVTVGFIFNQNRELSTAIKAGDFKPKNVKVSNITDSSAAISWESDIPADFDLHWSKKRGLLDDFIAKSTTAKRVHYIKISNLDAETTYEFYISRNNIKYINQNFPWQFKTLSKTQNKLVSKIVSGRVVSNSGLPVDEAIVFINLGTGELLTGVSDQKGSFFINLSLSTNNLDVLDTSILSITVRDSRGLISTGKVYVHSANSMPDIVIGENFDYTNLPVGSQSVVPQAEID